MILTLEYHMTRKRMSICLFCGNETSIVDWDLTEVGVYVKKTIKILNHKFVTSLSHTDRVNSLHWYYLIFSLEMEINISEFRCFGNPVYLSAAREYNLPLELKSSLSYCRWSALENSSSGLAPPHVRRSIYCGCIHIL